MQPTSEEALDSIDTTILEGMALQVITLYGSHGCISDQVRKAYPALAYSSMTARWANLEKQGFITRLGDKRPGISGRNQLVMRATALVTDALRSQIAAQLEEKKKKKKEKVKKETKDD